MSTPAASAVRRPVPRPCPGGEWACNGAFWVFLVLFVVQLAHFLEHLVQVHQIFLGHANTSGLFGARFDFVGVHLAYNVGVFGGLLWAWGSWVREPGGWRTGPGAHVLFLGVVLFQAYHAGEHLFQAYQYWVLDWRSSGANPPGLIGQFLPNPIAHFDLNLVLTLWMTAILVYVRPRRLRSGHLCPHGARAALPAWRGSGTGRGPGPRGPTPTSPPRMPGQAGPAP